MAFEQVKTAFQQENYNVTTKEPCRYIFEMHPPMKKEFIICEINYLNKEELGAQWERYYLEPSKQ